MAFDIYGNRLERGHCEVHPHVHQEYPCSLCLSDSRRSQAAHPSPPCDICGGPHGCADSNGYVVCSEFCCGQASAIPSKDALISAYTNLHADHVAFVARVREIAEGMEHAPDCDIRKPGHLVGGISFDVNNPPRAHEVKRKCTCPRGKLLEVCNG